ncbi:PHP domain-containing protein [Vagococcus zengguangii]|uniref:Histidinol-phosphatase n=1 Tax=Vagococcus zengguangii TaxID=2571750 RepID=A0A4D7CSC7_9ENTE|nr:PHP domain-containing protein [Vagococcus zengguangii]QCI85562.1 histidinol phosphate phosphatase [Vagococcus zengguangii]
MTYYDQHLHTYHSFDSSETFENYLARSPKVLVTTEHLDFKNPWDNFEDSMPNYADYAAEVDRLNAQQDIPILKGIEIGFVPEHWPLIQNYLAGHDYDVQLLSVHQNGEYDFMDDIVLTLEPETLIKDYYTRLLEAIKTVDPANIMTHFDYGVRRLTLDVETFKHYAEPYLIPVFKAAINKELAFELNAKSFVSYHNQALYEYAVPLYLSLGGKLFSLGSDAHRAEDYELGYDQMKHFLKGFGINELATYQQGKLRLVRF